LADDPTPHWQPLAALQLIASLIDGELADGQEHHTTLLSVRDWNRVGLMLSFSTAIKRLSVDNLYAI